MCLRVKRRTLPYLVGPASQLTRAITDASDDDVLNPYRSQRIEVTSTESRLRFERTIGFVPYCLSFHPLEIRPSRDIGEDPYLSECQRWIPLNYFLRRDSLQRIGSRSGAGRSEPHSLLLSLIAKSGRAYFEVFQGLTFCSQCIASGRLTSVLHVRTGKGVVP